MTKDNIAHMDWLRKRLEESDDDLLKELPRHTIQMLMGAEADALCGAEYRKRSSKRTNRRNGYRAPRAPDTRIGTLVC